MQLLTLPRRSFWAVKIPSNASWGWRKLFKLRQRARGLIQHIPGDGTETHLWHDNWHPSGPLVETYGTKIIQDAGIPSHAKLAVVVNGNYWKWPPARSPQLLDIQIALCGRLYPKEGEKDSMVWIPSASSSFKAGKTWHWIRNKQARVPWHKLVWFPQSIPKHSFICWLAMLDRLTTRARQKKWSPTLTDTCVLCNNDSETTEHLFFKCYYARRVWQVLSNLAGIPFMDSWQRLLMWMGKRIRRKSLYWTLIKLIWSAAIHHVWMERNNRIHQQLFRTEEAVCEEVQFDVKHRILGFAKLKSSSLPVSVAINWGIEAVVQG
ncbi:hypothetical protein SLEP1_g53811 [Rubroshorea leprosula]|uniref:Reverse transcriptase zinc-binding domain-containing protein n=1 Tax=Rubroshorea leprosula TaxID=152421 RepID=A0AAV5MAP0_9ROSI|nr:hypothetical protein SLEP1_g53811 [Rubroshorea leprosula]